MAIYLLVKTIIWKKCAYFIVFATTPVNIDALRKELQFYDSNEAHIILDGFCNGFPLNYVGPRIPSESKNLKLALIRPEITQQNIDKEVSEGRVAGPFTYPHYQIYVYLHLV